MKQEYKILEAVSADELVQYVQEYLQYGWHVLGQPLHVNGKWYQAVEIEI